MNVSAQRAKDAAGKRRKQRRERILALLNGESVPCNGWVETTDYSRVLTWSTQGGWQVIRHVPKMEMGCFVNGIHSAERCLEAKR